MSKKYTNNSFRADLQAKISDESMTANIIASQMNKTNDKLAFERALKGCVTRSEWFEIYNHFSDKALKFARENNYFQTLLSGKNAYACAQYYSVLEACANMDATKLINRKKDFATATPYSFFINSCKIRDFADIPNRDTFKRAQVWKVNKGFAAMNIAYIFQKDASNNEIPHDGSTQCNYILAVLTNLQALEKHGNGDTAFFRWNHASPVTQSLKALAE